MHNPQQRDPNATMLDPLAGVPHQTFQAHKQARIIEATAQLTAPAGSSHSQAAKPVDGKTAPVPAAAIIEAAPQLRDMRKEAAVFVPRAAKKKKAPAPAGGMVVNPAPAEVVQTKEEDSGSDGEGYSLPSAPRIVAAPPTGGGSGPSYSALGGGGLLGKLSSVLGPVASIPTPVKEEKPKAGDDYKAFLAGLDNLPQ